MSVLLLMISSVIGCAKSQNFTCNVHHDYCLKGYDEEFIINFTEYGGVYKFVACDNNSYPMFHQYKNATGHHVNNSGIIQFDKNTTVLQLMAI